jgi:peroxiredoxin Q/BCP
MNFSPGCTTEGQDFRDNHQAFLDANTIIYGVSKDDLTKHEKFKTKQAFPFELIADVEGGLCEAFDVWQLKKFMGREYMGIVRSTFIIDAKGRRGIFGVKIQNDIVPLRIRNANF